LKYFKEVNILDNLIKFLI